MASTTTPPGACPWRLSFRPGPGPNQLELGRGRHHRHPRPDISSSALIPGPSEYRRGGFRPTPPWPSNTDQFGDYYVRGPGDEHPTRQNPHRLDRHRRDGREHVRASAPRRLRRHGVQPHESQGRAALAAGAAGPKAPGRWPRRPTWSSPSSAIRPTCAQVILGPDGVLAGCRPGRSSST